MKLATKATLISEKVRDNETVGKVHDAAKAGAHAVGNSCGFGAYLIGKLFRPLTTRVKKTWDEYQEQYEE